MFNKNYPALSHLICLINIEQEPLKSFRVIVHSLQAPYIIQTVVLGANMEPQEFLFGFSGSSIIS